jgi:uncharacterized protein
VTLLAYIFCGVLAGLLGGYLGLGGGIVIVPFLTMVMGLDIKAAVPISMAAIVINSLASSSEYMKRGLVNLELMVSLSLSMVLGMICGSLLLNVVSPAYIKIALALVLLYAAYNLARNPESKTSAQIHSRKNILWCVILALLGGTLAGLVGVGGGVIVIPLMYLLLGVPLAVARGTSSFIVGFSGTASLAVYFFSGLVNLTVLPPVMLGAVLGGKAGGKLGALAKPVAVKIVFTLVILYVSARLIWTAIGDLK